MAIGNTAKLSIEIGIDSKTGRYQLRQIGNEIDTFGKKTKKAGNEADKSFKKMDKSASSFLGTIGSLKGAVGGLAGALAVREIVEAGVSFLETGIKVDRLSRSLETATGSYDSAAKAQAFLRTESERLGLVFLDQVKGYQNITAAANAYNFTTQEVQGIYLGVAEAATALQMTQDDVNGVFRAFTQILSKGKLQAEEIRGQIGERLPGAFNIAAKAMGVTVAELSKMLELGQVMSEDFIPKFSRQLRIEFAGGLEKAAQSAQANINRLKNTWLEMQIAVLSSGAMDAFQAGLKGVNVELKEWLVNNEDLIKQKVPGYVDSITESLKNTYTSLNNLKTLYDILPGNAADMGIVGYAMFRGGAGAGAIAAGLLMVNKSLVDLDMNLGSLPGKYKATAESLQNLMDVASGLRDAETGELIDQGPVTEARLKKELAGTQAMIDDWRDQNATPAGFIMSLFYGESPGEHWKREADRVKKELAEIQVAKDKLRTERAGGGFGGYVFDFEAIKSEATTGLQAVKLNFLEPYKFETDRVLEYGNVKWSEYYGLLSEMEGGVPDFKKVYDVEAPETVKARTRAIAGIVIALGEEEKAYQRTAGEIKFYGQEQSIATKGDTDRVHILIENFKLKSAAGKASIEDARELKASIDAIRQTEEDRIQGIEDIIAALEKERDTFGMTADQIRDYNLSKLEASDATKGHIAEIQKEIAVLKDLESAFGDVDKAAAESAKEEYFWEKEERQEGEREKLEKRAKSEKKTSSGDRWGEGRDGILEGDFGGDFGGGSDLSGLMDMFGGGGRGGGRTRGATTPEMQQAVSLLTVLMADIGRDWFGSLFGLGEKPSIGMMPYRQTTMYGGGGYGADRQRSKLWYETLGDRDTGVIGYGPSYPTKKSAEDEEESLLDYAKNLIESGREGGRTGDIENYGSVIISALGGYERDPSRKFGPEKKREGETEKTIGKYFDGIRDAASKVFGDVKYDYESLYEGMEGRADMNFDYMSNVFGEMGTEAEKSFLGMEYDSEGFFGHMAGGLGKTKEITSVIFDDMENTIAHFCETGKFNYTDFVSSVLTDTMKIINLQTAYSGAKGILSSIFGNLFGAGVSAVAGGAGGFIGGAFESGSFADISVSGGPSNAAISNFETVFGEGGYLTPGSGSTYEDLFGSGGYLANKHGNIFPSGISEHSNTITDRPTAFAFAKGAGIYGEAGPEAIMPLTRLPGGDLGVKAEGSATSEPRPLEIHIHEAPNTQTRVEQSNDGNQLNVIVEQVEQAMTGRMARGTGMAPFMDGRYQRGY